MHEAPLNMRRSRRNAYETLLEIGGWPWHLTANLCGSTPASIWTNERTSLNILGFVSSFHGNLYFPRSRSFDPIFVWFLDKGGLHIPSPTCIAYGSSSPGSVEKAKSLYGVNAECLWSFWIRGNTFPLCAYEQRTLNVVCDRMMPDALRDGCVNKKRSSIDEKLFMGA